MTKRYCTEEDVRQTVNMTFFQCVQRYERKDSDKGPIPFSAFLYSYFFYLLKKNVDTFLIDQLGRKSFAILDNSASENSEQESEGPGINIDTMEHAINDLMFAEPIDEFWVLGETAMTPFDELSVQERQLLKWKYIDKHRSSEIALKITEHPNTVREHMTKIKQKLKDIIEKNNMYDLVIPIDIGN
jgi:hypothetical protein